MSCLDFTTAGSTGYRVTSGQLYMPIKQFMWLGASYDAARQTIELFRYGGGYATPGADTFREVRLTTPPELVARTLGMGWGGTNNPSAQVSAAMYFEHRLTYDEMRLIATSFVPPVFIHGKFPFHYSDVPRSCPSDGASFDFSLYLPHTYGQSVTVTMTTPTGHVTPASLTWDSPKTAEGSRQVAQAFSCSCGPTGTTTFNLKLTGDTTHYWLPKTSFQVTQLDPSAISVFRLNPAAIAAPSAAAKEPAYNTISFDGWSQYLNLNLQSDTGVVPSGSPALNIPPFMMYADEDDWLPERVGYSFEGWYQPLSWNHAHTLFSNGPKEASYDVRSGHIARQASSKPMAFLRPLPLTVWISSSCCVSLCVAGQQQSASNVVISMTNMADYGYGLVYDANYNVPYYCQYHAPTAVRQADRCAAEVAWDPDRIAPHRTAPRSYLWFLPFCCLSFLVCILAV